MNQTYPSDRMEWIIIDDGTDKVDDLFSDIPQVKYFSFDTKLALGTKRNIMHEKASGEILVYFDDDDYYPPERISHAVETLVKNPTFLCVGCSELHIYFKHLSKMYKFGPYGINHATAATIAFRKEMLKDTKYDENACLAEEKQFLKNYTIPMKQLDPKKTILVFSHDQNSFDKKTLLDKPSAFVNLSCFSIDDFIPKEDKQTRTFFLDDIDNALQNYTDGDISNKPDVLKQIEEMRVDREKRELEIKRKHIEEIMALNPLELANMYEKKMFDQMKLLTDLKAQLELEKERNIYLNKKMTEIISRTISERTTKNSQ